MTYENDVFVVKKEYLEMPLEELNNKKEQLRKEKARIGQRRADGAFKAAGSDGQLSDFFVICYVETKQHIDNTK